MDSKLSVLNNPGSYHTASRKNRITLHKVRVSPGSDCFRRWPRCVAVPPSRLRAVPGGCPDRRRCEAALSKRDVPLPSFPGPWGPAELQRDCGAQDRLVGHRAGGLGCKGQSGVPAQPYLRARTWCQLRHNSWGRREHPAPFYGRPAPGASAGSPMGV